MSSKNIVILVAVIVLLIIGFMVFRGMSQNNTATQPSPTADTTTTTTTVPTTDSASPQASASAQTSSAIFTLSGSGVSPASVTIKAGESVTWVNNSGSAVQIASDPHPTHTDYPPLNIGMIPDGGQKSLQFPQAGTYKWHNHLRSSVRGTITVQ